MYWSQEDIEDLEIMYSNGFRTERITRALGRSKHAVRHALRNLLVRKFASCGTLQQLADELGTSKDVVRNMLAPSKYDLWSHREEAEADTDAADDSDAGSETDSNTQMAHMHAPESDENYSDDYDDDATASGTTISFVQRQRLAELLVERHAFCFAMTLFFTLLGVATMISYTP